MTEKAPRWLQVMRAITGTVEYPGDPDNPKILAMRDIIARAYPEMADYCDEYQHDETPWCGLTAAFCVTMAGIRPPFGPTDTDKFLWALAWADDPGFVRMGRPVPGTIVVMEREGGGHVTFYEETDGDFYVSRGGNQSDAVNVQEYAIDTVVALVWPKAAGRPPEIPIEDRPTLEEGDEGPDVIDLQRMLPRFKGEIDGDFGPVTEQAVIDYQRSRGLEVDGIVGEQTWRALYEDAPPVPPPPPPPGALTARQQVIIKEIANSSRIASYAWEDRGIGPVGWVQGLALAFAQTYKKLKADHPAAIRIARANTHDPDVDVLAWYQEEFDALGMDNETAGIEVLRHVYAFMLGLSIRESSGAHCCGKDQSASNTSADTCEAGMFQHSYDSHTCDSTFDPLMDEYLRGLSPGYLYAFSEGVECSSEDWENYGSPESRGWQFQNLCKTAPAFAAESCALVLRSRRQHFGPVNRAEVELKKDADNMLKIVQDYLDESEPVTA